MAVELSVDPALTGVTIRHLVFEQVAVAPASVKLSLWSDEITALAMEESKSPSSEALRNAVRKMLRHGKFKASGRSKPAQEYLLRCALEEGALPRINGPVDVLNTVSLYCGLPISLLSLKRCSRQLEVRRGLEGEGYVFNASGQVLDLQDLIVTCDRSVDPSRPVGSPIKDSMVGKIESSDTALVAIIYAPNDSTGIDRADHTAQLLHEKMHEYCSP